MKVAIAMTIADAMPAGPVARSMAQPRVARVTGRAAVAGIAALIPWPPSRCVAPEARRQAPRMVVPEARQAASWEACPRHRDTADAGSCRRRAGQRRGPAPAAFRASPRLAEGASLGPAPQRDPRVEHRVEHVHEHVD